MTTKTYTRRDSITAILRKKGVDKKDYYRYIIPVKDGFRYVEPDIDDNKTTPTKTDVEKTTKTVKVGKQKTKAKTQTTSLAQSLADNAGKPKPKKEKPVKKPQESISSFIRDLIMDNKTNAQIFEACQKKYGKDRFDESKKHYPAWYRCEMRRKGELPHYADQRVDLGDGARVIVED